MEIFRPKQRIMTGLRLLLLLPLLLACITHATGTDFTLGLLIPWDPLNPPVTEITGKSYAPAVLLAVENVNNRSDLLPGHHLSLIWNDTSCDETQALQALTYQIFVKRVDAIIGPACSCQTEARLASALDIPMISYMCNEPLYDSIKYSTFARTKIQVEVPKLSRGLVNLLHKFNWSQVAILYENTTQIIRYRDAVAQEFKRQKINVRLQLALPTKKCFVFLIGKLNFTCPGSNFRPDDLVPYMTRVIKQLKAQARIVLILGDYRVGPQFLSFAYNNMTISDYAFILVQLDHEQFKRNLKNGDQYTLVQKGKRKMNSQCDYFRAFESVIVVEIQTAEVNNETLEGFREQVEEKFKDPTFPKVKNNTRNIGHTAAYLYDAVYQYATALNKTLQRNEPPTGRNIIAKMLNSSYISRSGARVFIDQDGTADFADLRIVDIRWDSSGSRVNNCDSNAPYIAQVGKIDFSSTRESPDVVINVSAIQWPDGRSAPQDSPKCGFEGERCMTSSTSGTPTPVDGKNIEVIIGGVCAFASVIFIILLFIIIRQYMLKRELDRLLWKINYKDISWARTCPLSSADECEDDLSQSSTCKTSTQFTFTNFGFYKGNRVTVKQVGTKAIDITKHILLELKQMRDFRHENCVQFFGATIDPPNICIVSAFCPKTLKDFLACSDVKLDKTFVTSLVSDIAKGMAYLHSTELRSHGNLKSSNCLIDSRWTLKIADYGLTAFKAKCNLSSKSSCEDLLWTAPELLRDFTCSPRGTQKADVYSFAIILQEFHTRKGPYSNNVNVRPREIIKRVANAEEPIFRPTVCNFIDELEELRDLMKNCWEEDPDNRPDFTEIKRRIQRTLVNKGMKTNIFDSMIHMMENYADNLEDIVAEKTGLLIEAKRETEELLYKILPRSVAEQLKKGKSVEAENFDEVSIYFSDIVGFTELSSESSPMQVVTLLNDLYTLFDDIISEYRVYKVETIGDAYMVVSGLPIRIGPEHAEEISRMALHLLDSVKKDFVVRHKPGRKIDLRIGIHSGPVVAGVVGNTMPRYCLFGDTVNTASRMESNGEAFRIHISEATKKILEPLGTFIIEERGNVFLKGKGNMRTYWLVDYTQRELHRHLRSTKKARRSAMMNLFPCVDNEQSCITRSSSLRRSLKSASNSPSVAKAHSFTIMTNNDGMEDNLITKV